MRHSIPFALLLIASLFVTTTALAQQASEPNLRWGHPTQQEMEMTSYTPDPSADAVVLCKTTDAHYVITKDVLNRKTTHFSFFIIRAKFFAFVRNEFADELCPHSKFHTADFVQRHSYRTLPALA